MRTRQEIYLVILYRGLLNIRIACDDRDQCFAEADQLHNMPELLANLDKEELHDFYWRCMRPSYIRGSKPSFEATFEPLWKELKEATARERQL